MLSDDNIKYSGFITVDILFDFLASSNSIRNNRYDIQR